MSAKVTISRGVYRGQVVENMCFPLIRGIKLGKLGHYVTVDSLGHFGPEHTIVRVKVRPTDIVVDGIPDGEETINSTDYFKTESAPAMPEQTDEEIMNRIESRFAILDDMTRAAIRGDVRAVIVSGHSGIGKTYSVERQLEEVGVFSALANKKLKYEVIKGNMSPIGLYCTLYKYSDSNSILVLDDVDSLFWEPDALNILKAALDSSKKRRIYWHSDSSMLRREDIPTSFDFRGSIIFITNLNFANIKSKNLQDHLAALQSRCHYLDLTLNTKRDCMLRVRQIHRKGDLFEQYDFENNEGDKVIEFMEENQDRLREVSLRMAQKIADLVKVSAFNWKMLAETTCMFNE
jgi:predicted AAA+ superfamily ATPase